jgi:hypothetical protein
MKHALLGLAWSLLVDICASAAMLQPAAIAAGHWEGTIEVPGKALDIIVDLAGRPDGKWDGAITIPAQNVKGLVLSPLSVEGDTVTFGMKDIPGDPLFKGTVAKEPRSISGQFSQGGMTMPFTLAWKGEPKLEPPPKSSAITKDLEGSWEGSLNVQGNTLRLILELANETGGGVGTITSVDQGNVRIPIAQVTQTGTDIKLLVSAIGASYDGSFASGQIAGTWSQGGQKFPLVFKRAVK